MPDNIYTDGTYLTNNPDWNEADSKWKAGLISALIKKNKLEFNKVVEVGCGAGQILNTLSTKFLNVVDFSGYDISPQSIKLSKKISNNKLSFYNKDFLQEKVTADLLLVIDVVEHIDDYLNFLRQLKVKARHFIFHIPLDMSCRAILKSQILLQQRRSVGHIHYFTRDIVKWALEDNGYHIIDWQYTKPNIDSAVSKSFKLKAKKHLRNLSFTINKDISAKLWGGYSILILAK
ncbi:MAG: class I SAM-dependent methyltransferase [Ginsengibacter sp.]